MIIFERTKAYNIDNAIYAARNPLNSWAKSDSHYEFNGYETDEEGYFKCYNGEGSGNYILGSNDLNLAQRLIKGGSEHRKFLRQIFVSVDITAPLYWWKEFDTYKVGTVANSCSTMHTIHKKEFTLGDFSCEHLKDLNIAPNEVPPVMHRFLDTLEIVVNELNIARQLYLRTKDKKYWWQMIQLLPSSYNQKRTVTLNYENLRSMYFQRRAHKLDEWREGFIQWVETLPYAKELIIFEGE